MSHVTNKEPEDCDEQITNITALHKAIMLLGGVFKEGQKTFRTWADDHHGSFVGDYPVPEGYTAEELISGIAAHAIGFGEGKSGSDAYEIGVVPSRKFPGTFSLMYDFFGSHLDHAVQ